MKVLNKLASLALTASVIVGISSCAGGSIAQAEEGDGFGLMAAVGQAAPAAPGARMGHPGGPGGHGHFGGPMAGPMGFGMMKDLNLSDDQKAQFKALFESARASHQGQKPDMQGLHDTLKSAFLADNFDAAGLKAKLAQSLPQAGSRAPQMAANLIKAWNILTADQQAKVVSKLEAMEQKMQQWQQNRGDKGAQHGPEQHLQKLAEKLNLSADQQTKLKVLWQGGQPDRQAKMQEFRQVKQQVLAELKSGHPSADRIATLLAAAAPKGEGMTAHIDKMAALHDILTPAQRQQMVSLMEEHMQQMKQHMQHRGKGRHQRQNAQ